MSTRCNVKIKDSYSVKALVLYHHHDGYPEGVGKLLETLIYNKKITAYLDEYQVANYLIKGVKIQFDNHSLEDDEFELTRDIHGDIEYMYTIEMHDTKVINDEQYKNVVMLKCEEHDGNRATRLVYEKYFAEGVELK